LHAEEEDKSSEDSFKTAKSSEEDKNDAGLLFIE